MIPAPCSGISTNLVLFLYVQFALVVFCHEGEAQDQAQAQAQAQAVLSASFQGPVTILPSGDPQDFPIHISAEGTVAEVTVAIDIDHPQPTDLIVKLRHPNGIEVVLPGDLGVFAGRRIMGDWVLSIANAKDGMRGKLLLWSIKIEPAQLASLSIANATQIENATQFLQIQVDGYGSFGGTKEAGAIYQPSPEIEAESTVFQSALFLHQPGIFLSAYDSYPGKRLPSIPVTELLDTIFFSRFAIDGISVNLIQSLQQGEGDSFLLTQVYDFSLNTPSPEPFVISRYINSKLITKRNNNTLVLNKNYHAIRLPTTDDSLSMFVFNEIQSATTDKSTFIEISYQSDLGSLHGYQVLV